MAILYLNHVRITQECLDSVLANGVPPERIILVDNGSLKQHHDVIRCPVGLIHHRIEVNQGFSGGFNACCARAIEEGAEELLFLSNDTRLVLGSFERLLEHPFRESCDLLAPLIRPCFNRNLIDSLGAYFCKDTALLHHYTRLSPSRFLEVGEYIPASALWLRLASHRQIGGMDKDYFCYWDDVDYSFRLQQAGARLGTLSEVEFEHHIGKTNRSKSLYTVYYYHRNRFKFVSRHFPELRGRVQEEILSLKQKYAKDPQRLSWVEQIFQEISKGLL